MFALCGKLAPEVCAATTTLVDDLYAFTESSGTCLKNISEADINVLTAQRLYINRYVAYHGPAFDGAAVNSQD